MNIFPTIEMMGYDAGKPAFAGSPQSAQADFLFSIAHDFNRGTNVGVTENYVWNADGTLASFPGPGYTRLLEYDEEGRLIRIRRDYGNGNVQLAYEYAYGFDGGRRWRKDYLNGVWTRYPCGVACGAGDLVEQQKPLEGGTWTTTALYLQGISLVRRNNEWHHFDPLGTAGVITNGSASVISSNLYDLFGVLRYEQGSAQTPWRWIVVQIGDEAGTALFHSQLGIVGTGIWCASYATASGFFSDWTGWLRPFVTPLCLGCLGGFAAPLLALIMDCGVPNPFNTQWRECVGNAVNAFKEECQKDAICHWIFNGCLSVCGGSVLIGLEKPNKPAEPVKKRHPIPRHKRLDISQW